jgi:N-acetylmuramoyl-L-alanine amidase
MRGAWAFRLAVWGLLLGVLVVAFDTAAEPASARSKPTVAKDARLAGDAARTRFIADLSKKVDVSVFALGDPYRVIIDLPDVNFQMPVGISKEKRGLVTGYRYGLFASGKSRIVIDVDQPFLIDKVFVLDARPDQPARLVVDLVPTDRATFLAKLKEARAAPPPPPVAQSAEGLASEDGTQVVVLDPGHGGVDPGTMSPNGTTEKEVVLAFAKTLKAELEKDGRYKVYLTREDDTFLPLRERVTFAKEKRANLFLSIHADSLPNHKDEARGATVYTLSEQASDNEAKELAAKENFSDAIAGVELPPESDEAVANILIDLARRETQNHSTIFAKSVVGQLKGNLHALAPKSAGFRVLKSPDVPSVLLELGYLSNPEDEQHLKDEAWCQSTAKSVAAAIDSYFAKRVARSPF